MLIPIVLVWLMCWLTGFLLTRRIQHPRSKSGAGVDAARVSIIIPARNEAHNLPRLLRSIREQNIELCDVCVVDDDSSDGTAELAREAGARVVVSKPLPAGWRGKPWACDQGVAETSGEWLLFMDADTWFEPGGLARVLAAMDRGALSIVPYHEVVRVSEDASMFFNLCMSLGTIPNGLCGQFMIVHRRDLERVGGHASVRDKILENFHMAENFHRAGIPVGCLPGKGMLSVRMYPSGLGSLLEGWVKGFASGAGKTPGWVLFWIVVWMTALMLPPFMLWLSGGWMLGLVAWLACVMQLGYVMRRVGGFSWISFLIYPVHLAIFFMVFAWSVFRRGKKVTWKGREIDAA